jgi:hypothetical protein
MKTRSEEYIQLFEGFKLGSLGVSHKPKITVDIEQSPIVIIEEGTFEPSGDEPEKRPYFHWKERRDKLTYFMTMSFWKNEFSKKRVYFIQIACGEDLEKLEKGFTRYDWKTSSSSGSYPEMISLFHRYVDDIKQGNLDGLIASSFNPDDFYLAEFKEWKKQRRKPKKK